MTEKAQRIAIAEACGWKMHPKDKWVVTAPNMPNTVQPLNTIPNYLSDLNAIHEAEKMLTDDQFDRYRADLWFLAGNHNAAFESCAPMRYLRRFISAAAAQRAEAFLRTLGKWDDSK